jgi:hypothetical protein
MSVIILFMEKNESPLSRLTINLPPDDRRYLDALVAHNRPTGGVTDVVRGLIRIARGFGEMGVTDTLHVNAPDTGERTVCILTIGLVGIDASTDRPPVSDSSEASI